MPDDFTDEETGNGLSRLATFGIAVGTLIVVVAIISALVLSGAVKGDEQRSAPEGSSTTVPTVEIAPQE